MWRGFPQGKTKSEMTVECHPGGPMADGKIRAWLETHSGKPGVLAAFIGVAEGTDDPPRRSPATRFCASFEEAGNGWSTRRGRSACRSTGWAG